MVISKNSLPTAAEFEKLLSTTVAHLNNDASKKPKIIAKLNGNKLEPYVCDAMKELAFGTPFENSIELISGQKFPDIIANRLFGVEVKSTSQNHWKTTGNSVLESTRVENIDRIYMLFGKLCEPLRFKAKSYEACLSEVVVTHSPRYLVDMNLQEGETIFDKIGISYDELRQSSSPINSIVSYYKKILKPGQKLWWIDQNTPSNLVVDIWHNLPRQERGQLMAKAMAFFPKVFSKTNLKFTDVTLWLLQKESIVCPNIRDVFSAGGRGQIKVDDVTYHDVPRIIINLFKHLEHIVQLLKTTTPDELGTYWYLDDHLSSPLSQWIDDVSTYQKLEFPLCKEALYKAIGRIND